MVVIQGPWSLQKGESRTRTRWQGERHVGMKDAWGDAVKSQGMSHVVSAERPGADTPSGLGRNQPCRRLDLGLQASGVERGGRDCKHLCWRPPSLWGVLQQPR